MPSLKKIPRLVQEKIRNAIRDVAGYPVVRDAMGGGSAGPLRRALLVYLVDPFLMSEHDPRFLGHQNMRQCRQIAAALAGAGYCVDVADVRDPHFHPDRAYDLVLSHRADLGDPAEHLHAALRVYLATGLNHVVHNRNVRLRYDALRARRQCAIGYPPANTETMPFVRSAHAVAGFGNSTNVGTWSAELAGPIFPFNNYGYGSTRDTATSKEFTEARRHFLFFASRDQVA